MEVNRLYGKLYFLCKFNPKVGENGRHGVSALRSVVMEEGQEKGSVQDLGAETHSSCRRGLAMNNLALPEPRV